jgi:hypothetical protein
MLYVRAGKKESQQSKAYGAVDFFKSKISNLSRHLVVRSLTKDDAKGDGVSPISNLRAERLGCSVYFFREEHNAGMGGIGAQSPCHTEICKLHFSVW